MDDQQNNQGGAGMPAGDQPGGVGAPVGDQGGQPQDGGQPAWQPNQGGEAPQVPETPATGTETPTPGSENPVPGGDQGSTS